MRTSILAATLAAVVIGAPAFACEPAPFAAGTRQDNGNCSMSYFDDVVTQRGTGYASDLSGGFVAQYYTEGNACYMTASMIVVDCNAGKAVIFGPGPTVGAGAGMPPASDPFERLSGQVEAAGKAGKPMSLGAVLGGAQGKFANAVAVAVPGRVKISNDDSAPRHSFDLSCGCKLYYPGSAGAGN